jgi:hypothetical protein
MAGEEETKKQPDFVLNDKTELYFDLDQLSVKEWRTLLSPDQKDEDADKVLERVSGLSQGRINTMGYMEWRRLIQAFFRKAGRPLDDPN